MNHVLVLVHQQVAFGQATHLARLSKVLDADPLLLGKESASLNGVHKCLSAASAASAAGG